MSQAEFAKAFHIPVGTIRNWEQNRVKPDPAACALLTILYRQPDAALKAFRAAQQAARPAVRRRRSPFGPWPEAAISGIPDNKTSTGRTGDAGDGSAAARTRAGQPFPVINGKCMLEIAQFAVRAAGGRAGSSRPPRSLRRARRGSPWPKRPGGGRRLPALASARDRQPGATATAGRGTALHRRRCCPGRRSAAGRAARF